MRAYLIPLAIAVVTLLVACATRPPQAQSEPLLQLLPPSELLEESLLKQKLTLSRDGREQQLLAVVRLERAQIRLLVLTPVGQQLLSLDYDGETLLQDGAGKLEIPGRQVLASLQFALWPMESIHRHYRDSDGWRVESDESRRILLTSTGALLIIRRNSNDLTLDNPRHNFRVFVETLEKTAL